MTDERSTYLIMIFFLLWIEVTKVLDVPWAAHVRSVVALQSVGSWDDYAAHDEGSFPWGS